jgi:hypothetical protein
MRAILLIWLGFMALSISMFVMACVVRMGPFSWPLAALGIVMPLFVASKLWHCFEAGPDWARARVGKSAILIIALAWYAYVGTWFYKVFTHTPIVNYGIEKGTAHHTGRM